MQELLAQPLSKKEHSFRQNKESSLDKHFAKNEDLTSRNYTIMQALKDGYTQGEAARHLGVSTTLISYVFMNYDD